MPTKIKITKKEFNALKKECLKNSEIAERLGCSISTVQRKNREFNSTQRRSYEGASRRSRFKNWRAGSTSVNTELGSSLVSLRNRSRDLVRNNPYARRGIDTILNNAIGKGITGTIKHPDEQTAELLNEKWKEWTSGTGIDHEGQLNLAGLQRLVLETTLTGGEALIWRKISRKKDFPLSFQVLEGDHLEVHRSIQKKNENIKQGIEFDEDGQRSFYHLLKNHPGEFLDFKNHEYLKVPANEISHVFKTHRPGQIRGIPEPAPIISRLRSLDEYEDAQLIRQKIAACFSVFITDSGDLNGKTDEEVVEMLDKVEPGLIQYLSTGEDVKFGDPPTVDGYGEFVRIQLKAIAVGLGISYECFSGDLSDTNFSSGRMGFLEQSRTIDVWRWLVLKPKLLDFIEREFFRICEIQGDNVEGASMVWTAPKREMIDPTKEVPATIKAIRAGLTTRSEEVRKAGNDPDKMIQEYAEDMKKVDELGIKLDSDPRHTSISGVTQSEEGQDESTE